MTIFSTNGFAKDTKINLLKESSSTLKNQVRIYNNNTEEQILNLSEKILKKNGYCISMKNNGLGLLRARKDNDVYNMGKDIGMAILSSIIPVPGDVDNDRRDVIMITTCKLPSGVRVRAQMTFTLYSKSWKKLKSGVLSSPDLYKSFFEKLDKKIKSNPKG